MYRRIALVGLLTVAVTGLGSVQLLPGNAPVAHADGLAGYRNCADLLQAYRSELARMVTSPGYQLGWPMAAAADSSTAAGSVARQSSEAGAVGSGLPAPTCRSRVSTSRTWPSCRTAGWSS